MDVQVRPEKGQAKSGSMPLHQLYTYESLLSFVVGLLKIKEVSSCCFFDARTGYIVGVETMRYRGQRRKFPSPLPPSGESSLEVNGKIYDVTWNPSRR